MEALKTLKMYSPNEIDEVPDVPGLYAWYARLPFGDSDWKLLLKNGADSGDVNCRRLLQTQTTAFAQPPIPLSGTGTFSTNWRGELHDDSTAELANQLSEPADEDSTSTMHKHLDSLFASEGHRKAMLEMVQMATPILSAPLYVGKATKQTLRQRLFQHTETLLHLAEVVSKNPSARETLASSSKNVFAVRAIAAGFTPESLCVLPFPIPNMHEAGTEKVVEATEYLLNRWHRPPFGVR